MKTQRAGSKVLKNLLLILSVAMIAVSCGQDNTSGKSGNNNGIGVGGFGAYGTNGGVTLDQALQVIGSERQCLEGGQRQIVQLQLNQQVNAGAVHFGVSSFGDIAVTSGNIVQVYACPRAGQFAQSAQQINRYILETSQNCPVSQITSGPTVLNVAGAGFGVIFTPIHIPGYRNSQLCTNYQY